MLFRFFRSISRRLAAISLTAVGLALPAGATWSIVVVDTATGEVIVAGATCIADMYLPQPIACIAVGKGGGASQAFVLHLAKGIMFDGFQAGKTPDEILADIFQASPNGQTRQYGIVGMNGSPVTFSGSATFAASLGVTGEMGSIRYSIQGNILAQDPVVFAAEQALLEGEGDLAQRVMLAMEAATAAGGDGRCSCTGAVAPCGQPLEFRRASATAFLIASRLGDIDSTTCAVTNNNCSNGDYYGLISEVGNFSTPDPVSVLRRKFDIWRASHAGRPDHFNTEVFQSAQVLKVSSADLADIDISLVDLDGRPLISGGQTVQVSVVEGPALAVSAVIDNGDGTHQFNVSGATSTGVSKLRIVIQDGVRDVQLTPDLEIRIEPDAELFASQYMISATTGGLVRFEIDSPLAGGAAYHLLGSASGTQPGIPFGNLHLPLNRDRILGITVNAANGPLLPNSAGVLSASGQGEAFFGPGSGLLGDYVGSELSFYVYQLGGQGSVERLTNLATVLVGP